MALAVIDGNDLRDAGTHALADALDGASAGIWMWQQSPSSLLARYGSVRGASSFDVSYPKVYIDGIEMANPLALTDVVPESVDRIELIRGPQGAALYGADAISGVVNIVSRFAAPANGVSPYSLRSSQGASASAYSTRSVLSTDETASARFGTNLRSANVVASLTSLGAYVPRGYERHVSVAGTGRLVAPHAIATGIVRFAQADAGSANSPVIGNALTDAPPAPAGGLSADTSPQRLREYTIGGRVAFAPSEIWTHTLVLGADKEELRGIVDQRLPIPSAIDPSLIGSDGGATRLTARLASVAKLPFPSVRSADLTLALEESNLWTTDASSGLPMFGAHRFSDDHDHSTASGSAPPIAPGASPVRTASSQNSGALAQINTELNDVVSLHAGGRIERSTASDGEDAVSFIPMLGGSVVKQIGGALVKWRAAYGKGIRPPETAQRLSVAGPSRSAITLSPEEQSGVEAGIDVFVRSLSFQITRFDQRATGLIQPVLVAVDPMARPAGGADLHNHVAYELQNVGAISNSGWELEHDLRLGSVDVSGAWTLVDSRVTRVAAGYAGDLRAGDRMLDVPRRTASLAAAYRLNGWLVEGSVRRASDWVDYDRVALSIAAIDTSGSIMSYTGTRLRDYWKTYAGVTRASATVTRSLNRGLDVTLRGDNLFNQQRNEPDNVTIVAGRTIAVGFRTRF